MTLEAPAIALTIGSIAALVAFAEWMSARGVRGEVTRKTVHVVGGAYCVALPWIAEHVATVVLLGLLIAGTFDLARRTGRLSGLHAVGRAGYGPTLFPLGVVGAALITWDQPALYVASVLVLTLGDAAAALVGERARSRRYAVGDHHRSLEGSATLLGIGAIVPTAILGGWQGVPWPEAALTGAAVGLLVAALEGISPSGLDNLAIPIGAALLLVAAPAPMTLAGAVVLPLGVSGVALWRRNVTLSGALAVFALGLVLVVAGGAGWFLAALFVFGAVNVASRVRRHEKNVQAKGATRDHLQILANAGLAIPAAAGFAATGHPAFVGAAVGALAFSGADTLASELGVLSRRTPVAITTGRPVPVGTSGGVTPAGYGAASLGAMAPGLGLWLVDPGAPGWLAVGLVAGLVGCTVDSLLGDLAQARFSCPTCGTVGEREVCCDAPTAHARGVRWMDNDAVNLLGSVASTAVGAALAGA